MPRALSEDSAPRFALLLAIAIAIVYLSFLTRQYYWDGIAFAQTIEDASRLNSSLVHPNHLIYNAVGYLFYRLLRLTGTTLRAVTALQILNSLLSAAAAGTLFLILRRTLHSLYLSICLTVLFAFSATWWKFSTDADAYIASVLFVLIGFYLILPGSKLRPFAVGLTFLLSIVFHELAIFFGFVLVIGLVQQGEDRRERVIAVSKFLAFTAITGGLVYFLCFYFATGKVSPLSFLRWITYHSPDGDFSFSPLANLKYTLRGHVRLFFGGRFNLLNGLMNPVVVALLAILAAAVLMLAYSLMSAGREARLVWPGRDNWKPDRRGLFRLVLLWLTLYEVFLFFWIPQNTFYRLFYLPALILLFGLIVAPNHSQSRRRPTYRLASFVAALTLSNFLFLIFPYSKVEKYPPLDFAVHMNTQWPAGATILFATENSDESLVRYFTPGKKWKKIDTTNPAELDKALNESYSRGESVWLETTAIDNLAATESGTRWLEAHAVKNSLREVTDPAYRIRFLQARP